MTAETYFERREAEGQTQRIARWLMYTPPGDINFKNALEAAPLTLLERILELIPAAGNKTHRQVIERRIRKLQKQEWG